MKKVLIISLSFLVCFTIFASIVISTPSTTLYLLNWGEYIDHELVAQFEEEYHCQVIEECVTSSEAMYQKITAGSTSYDVAIPGDYTVHQLYDEGYLVNLAIDDTRYENLNNYKDIFSTQLSDLMATYMVNEEGKEFNSYFMPYFWGAYSMIYTTDKEDVGSTLKSNGFKGLYDRSLFSSDVKIGMYDTARWIVASYLMANDYDPNITSYDGSKEDDLSTEIKNDAIEALQRVKFNEFGNDSLKRDVANGTLDFCFTQLGDFFDALYLVYDESEDDINFDVIVPETTSAFFDSMIIPKTYQNYDLANAFINFMLDPNHAYQNATAIGYSPTLKSVVSLYEEAAENGEYYYGEEGQDRSLTLKDFLAQYPMYLNPLVNSKTVYMFEPKSNQYLTTCETVLNSLA
ncbi:extracellular solute-binding protein [Treponema rectale]|uniref:Extracellular solute-binding protein n=1 Tax=Treponema rectale TaxID=744512 RepID=A0A7M1XJ45_9SPIR|nr:extracellular solute-binding protein [Treponema rectale]